MWQLIGIVLLAITYIVHKDTYFIGEKWEKHKLKECLIKVALPRYVYVLIIIISLIPGLNLMCFTVGFVSYIGGLWCDCITFRPNNKFLKYLTEEV